jgi:hypothetical protein
VQKEYEILLQYRSNPIDPSSIPCIFQCPPLPKTPKTSSSRSPQVGELFYELATTLVKLEGVGRSYHMVTNYYPTLYKVDKKTSEKAERDDQSRRSSKEWNRYQ